MTGDDLIYGVSTFAAITAAILIPAAISTLIRKHAVTPKENQNIAANILLPPLIYFSGFLIAWVVFIYHNWDGSKSIEKLLIGPFVSALVLSIYAALIGASTALFSIKLPRSIKSFEHHMTICAVSMIGATLVLMYAQIQYKEYLSESTAKQPQPYVEYQPQRDAPLGTSQNQINIQFDKMLDQAEQRYSPLNPSSPNYNQRLVDEIEARVSLYESQGSPAPIALRRAVKEVTSVEIFIPPAQ